MKLDLSKNQLTCLPDDLGSLVNLQHLDLYNNKLSILPVSFCQLRSLKWLDLKDNPLEVSLAKAAGDCLDEKQCKQCAGRVLKHMQMLQEEAERAREKRLLREKELEKKKEAKQREREAREKEARKRQKAEEKEKRRKEYKAQMSANAAATATAAAVQEQQKRSEEKKSKKKNGQAVDKKMMAEAAAKPRWSVLKLLFLLLLIGLASATAICRLLDLRQEEVCVAFNLAVDHGLSWAQEKEGMVTQLLYNLSAAAKDLLESTQASKS
nr:leucine-rich repeat-containing protein 59 isoform X2 [Doryrhamphus excisus]